jgi:dTDP-4-amino-4,6-dideoxygalactose transaminase
MAAIHALSLKYGFKIIEDGSHAIGAKYRGETVGNCRYSDITVFSFHPVKIITTAEGGMALTNDAKLAKKMTLLRSHGISSTSEDMVQRPGDEIWNYQQIDLGFNYRMTELQAALGLSQLQRLDQFVSTRQNIACYYDHALSGVDIQTPWQHPDALSSFHLYPIQVTATSGMDQQSLYQALTRAGVLVNLHYIPVYRQPYYARLGFKPGYCPHAEDFFKTSISIPVYASMTSEQQHRVVELIQSLCHVKVVKRVAGAVV